MSSSLGLLEYALLGLLAQEPRSGYDLRKVFQETPLGHYSDSPGTIYPALARMESRRLIRGRVASGGRRRRLLAIAPKGRDALLAWLDAPVDVAAVSKQRGALELRLAFYSDHRTPTELGQFLRDAAESLDRLHRTTQAAWQMMSPSMTPSGRIALGLGVHLLHEKAAWIRRAVPTDGADR